VLQIHINVAHGYKLGVIARDPSEIGTAATIYAKAAQKTELVDIGIGKRRDPKPSHISMCMYPTPTRTISTS
jgi:hypothetical protein